MQRFYFSQILDDRISIADPDFVHQISKVLRYQPGDRVMLFSENGGGEYQILSIHKREILLSRVDLIPVSRDPEKRITLYQAIPNRYEKIEYLLQKGTEVGVCEFVFFPAERSQKLAISSNKITRFEMIVREAVEQCGGFRLPKIRFADIPEKFDFPTVLLHTDTKIPAMPLREFSNLPTISSEIGILVGPEGGFSSSEGDTFLRLGAVPVTIGERILRTETAWVVSAFFLLQTFSK